jgi:hypothetical protein
MRSRTAGIKCHQAFGIMSKELSLRYPAVSLVLAFLATASTLSAQSSGADLFEKRVRPVLVSKCYACHASGLKTPMSGLTLDTKSGLLKGGSRGPAIVP